MLYQIIVLLAVHFAADFVFQTHWQAQNKSKNNQALLSHVATYTACLMVAGPFVFPTAPVSTGTLWVISNGLLHFLTDWITSRWTSKLWSQQRWHDFFVVVGFDQWIHYTTLFTTAHAMGLF